MTSFAPTSGSAAQLVLPVATSTGSRNPLRLVWHDMSYGLRAMLRSPLAVLVSLMFPLLFNVLFNMIYRDRVVEGISNAQFTTAAVVVFIITSTGYFNMGISVVVAREKGVLKRIRQTPVSRIVHLSGRVLLATLVSAVSVTIMILVSVAVFELRMRPIGIVTLVVTFLLGCFACAMLGMAVTRLIPTIESGLVIVTGSLFPLLFVSGVFFPVKGMPGWLQDVLDLLPLAPMATAVRGAFDMSASAPVLPWTQLAVLLAWSVLGMVLVVKTMPWETRR